MSNKKGVTLAVLVTMALLMALLIGTITAVSINAIDFKRANEVKADLRILTDKIEDYYLKNDFLPVYGIGMTISSGVPTSIHKIGANELPLNKRNQFDIGKYFLIDYNLLEGLSLNYFDRAYVVNEGTHTVYVLNGYYTTQGEEYALPYVNKINEI